jgi:hypothetical protein
MPKKRSLIHKEQTKVPDKLGKIEDNQHKDRMNSFGGQWAPQVDPIMIGEENFQILRNMRYNDAGIEGVNGYDNVNPNAIATYLNIKGGMHFRTNRSADSYIIAQAQDGSGNGKLVINKTAIGSEGDFATGIGEQASGTKGDYLWSDSSANLVGRFSNGPSGSIGYCNEEESKIWSGEEGVIGSVFTTKDASETDPIDVTEKLTNSRTDANNRVTVDSADRDYMVILTTRPAQSFKFYVHTGNGTASTWVGTGYSGTAFDVTLANQVDGTDTGPALAQTGEVTFDFRDRDALGLMHFEGRYLYAYRFVLSAGSAVISEITANYPMQSPSNIWDGLYRVPIQCQFYDSATATYEDFTLHVNESSTVNTPVGAILDGMITADKLIFMFEDRLAAVKMTMLGNLVNETGTDRTITLKYWDGDSFEDTSAVDGTAVTAGQCFSQSGLIHWNPPTDEEKTTLFGTIGYAYEITVGATLSGDKGGAEEIVIDLMDGIPARKEIEVYKFPADFKNKLLMAGYVKGNEGNRVDYCADNAPDVWNGEDTSLDGFQSLRVGGIEELTGATQLYNRFGSNIFAFLVLFKNSEMYLLVGDGPLDYKLYPISFTMGCPAPQTISTAEVGLEVGENVARNIAMWISHSGPMMFDGATLQRVEGLEKYFDPNEAVGVNFDLMDTFQGWFDSTYREWNVLLASGSSATELNSWFCYDLQRKKWFEKKVHISADDIQCGFNTIASNGRQYVYGGSTTGFMYQLEEGTAWATGEGTSYPMVNVIQTGDFFPSGNKWDTTTLRRIKLAAKRVTEVNTRVTVSYYPDTEFPSGAATTFRDVSARKSNTSTKGVRWRDVTAGLSNSGAAGVSWPGDNVLDIDLSLDLGLKRIARDTASMNRTAWCHSIRFEFSSLETGKGLQPMYWGYEWFYNRKDHQDNNGN